MKRSFLIALKDLSITLTLFSSRFVKLCIKFIDCKV